MNVGWTVEQLSHLLTTHYVLEKTLGTSSMSQINLYRHSATKKRLISIKSLNCNDDVYRKMLSIKHPNLPAIYEVASSEKEQLVLEEYLQGVTLEQKLKTITLSYSTAIDYMVQICEAVAVLHKNNIVHRDIKPANIMICGDKVKLIDFGISRLMKGSLISDTLTLGTIGYASPEQMGLLETNAASDIYSLGILFNELLTGCHPTEKTPKGRAGSIVRKCTQLEISKRYSSAEKLKKAILQLKKFPFRGIL